jgi:hypothetical protein
MGSPQAPRPAGWQEARRSAALLLRGKTSGGERGGVRARGARGPGRNLCPGLPAYSPSGIPILPPSPTCCLARTGEGPLHDAQLRLDHCLLVLPSAYGPSFQTLHPESSRTHLRQVGDTVTLDAFLDPDGGGGGGGGGNGGEGGSGCGLWRVTRIVRAGCAAARERGLAGAVDVLGAIANSASLSELLDAAAATVAAPVGWLGSGGGEGCTGSGGAAAVVRWRAALAGRVLVTCHLYRNLAHVCAGVVGPADRQPLLPAAAPPPPLLWQHETTEAKSVSETVAEYYARRYGPLQFPGLPCLVAWAPDGRTALYFPAELCKVEPPPGCPPTSWAGGCSEQAGASSAPVPPRCQQQRASTAGASMGKDGASAPTTGAGAAAAAAVAAAAGLGDAAVAGMAVDDNMFILGQLFAQQTIALQVSLDRMRRVESACRHWR